MFLQSSMTHDFSCISSTMSIIFHSNSRSRCSIVVKMSTGWKTIITGHNLELTNLECCRTENGFPRFAATTKYFCHGWLLVPHLIQSISWRGLPLKPVGVLQTVIQLRGDFSWSSHIFMSSPTFRSHKFQPLRAPVVVAASNHGVVLWSAARCALAWQWIAWEWLGRSKLLIPRPSWLWNLHRYPIGITDDCTQS